MLVVLELKKKKVVVETLYLVSFVVCFSSLVQKNKWGRES